MTSPNDTSDVNIHAASHDTEQDVTEVVESLVDRLRAVRETYERQVQAENALQTERVEIDSARQELAERNAQLHELKEEIAVKGAVVDRTDAEAERRREALSKLEQDIQQRTAEVGSREREAQRRQDSLREEREHLRRLKEDVDEDRQNLVRRASELEQREAELTRQAAEAISGEDRAHHRQLLERYEAERRQLEPKIKQIEDAALQTQRELEAKLAMLVEQSEKREKELNDRLREQQDIAGSLRNQLAYNAASRRRMLEDLNDKPETPKRPDFSQRVDSSVARRTGMWLCWLTALAFLGVGAIRQWSGGETALMAPMFGFAFGALYFGSHSVARKLLFPPAIAVGLIGTSAGLWFPKWIAACEVAAGTWDIPMDSLPAAIAASVPLAFAVLSASAVFGLAMMISTGSWMIGLHIAGASVVSAGLVLVPDESGAMLYIAALLWLLIVGTSMSQWGSSTGEQCIVRRPATA